MGSERIDGTLKLVYSLLERRAGGLVGAGVKPRPDLSEIEAGLLAVMGARDDREAFAHPQFDPAARQAELGGEFTLGQ